MSVVFSGTNQGSFTSDGTTKILQIRADVDWINVYNTTIAAANQTTAVGVQYYWQRGFPAGAMIKYFKSNAANAANLTQYLTTGGFSLVNNTINVPGASVALTSITNATPPVVATGNTAGLSNGDVVRIFNTAGGQQLGGLDFTIGAVTTNTSFTLAFMRAIAAATTGTFRRIPYDPYFYPPTRVISKISQATQAIVTFTVTHAYTVGQKIRFVIPTVSTTAYGMTELNGVEATIVAINQADTNGVTNTVTVDVDTSAFTAFAWPLTTDPVHTPAQVVPVGENTAQAIASGVNVLGDSEVNQGYIGIALAGGAGSPGGADGEVIYWVAGKSFSGGA
jgi:hypothetical protein